MKKILYATLALLVLVVAVYGAMNWGALSGNFPGSGTVKQTPGLIQKSEVQINPLVGDNGSNIVKIGDPDCDYFHLDVKDSDNDAEYKIPSDQEQGGGSFCLIYGDVDSDEDCDDNTSVITEGAYEKTFSITTSGDGGFFLGNRSGGFKGKLDIDLPVDSSVKIKFDDMVKGDTIYVTDEGYTSNGALEAPVMPSLVCTQTILITQDSSSNGVIVEIPYDDIAIPIGEEEEEDEGLTAIPAPWITPKLPEAPELPADVPSEDLEDPDIPDYTDLPDDIGPVFPDDPTDKPVFDDDDSPLPTPPPEKDPVVVKPTDNDKPVPPQEEESDTNGSPLDDKSSDTLKPRIVVSTDPVVKKTTSPTVIVLKDYTEEGLDEEAIEYLKDETVACADPFVDTADSFAALYICKFYNLGFVIGRYKIDSDYYFEPTDELTFAEAIKEAVLMDGHGTNEAKNLDAAPFEDVSSKDWFDPYIRIAWDEELLDDKAGEDYLNPNDPISRIEFLKYIELSADVLPDDTGCDTDFDDVSSKESCIVERAVEDGVIEGYDDDTFAPDRYISREEAIKIAYKMFQEWF
ncbi:MAG: S-layer homology domain-containing protein [Candidatus Gracilibacteria bacterium]|jgi:hypothetical protein